MFKKQAEDITLKPTPLLRPFKSFDYRTEKELISMEILREKHRLKGNREQMASVKHEETKLNDDALRYAVRMDKAKKRIEYMRLNIGNTQAFLQQNQYLNQLAQQYMIQNSQQDNNNQPNPDNMTYEELLQLGDKIGRVSKGLTLQQMESLKRVMYSRVKNRVEDKCTVCCEEYQGADVLIELACRHCYHQQCLIGWLKEENVCPLCKKSVI